MNKPISSIILNKDKYHSYYDNTVGHYIGHEVKLFLLAVFTLGFAMPWIVCMSEEAKCKHTVICGKRLKFIGQANELLKHWIFWWLLCVITLGLYSFVVKIRFKSWVAANTIFEDTPIN